MTQLQSPVLPSGGNLPPVFAPTRRSARPTPGEPIAVAVVPGNPAPIAPMRQTAPVQHVRPLPPVFVPPSFAPSARPAPVTPAPATVTRAPAPAAVRPSPVAVSPVAPAYAPADVPPPIFARPMPDAYAAKATGSKLSDAKYAQVPPPEVQVAHHQEIRQLSPKNAKREKAPKAKRKRHPLRIIAISLVLLLVAALAWPTHLLIRYNNQINHVEALSGRANTPGTTFLLAGTDLRSEDDEFGIDDGVVGGSRSDSIILIHKPRRGPVAMLSLPRDTYVQIPGRGGNKLNAAYAFGGPKLLVATVEELTGLSVDHYVEISMGGLGAIVNAVGGIELCMDRDVNDENSGLIWNAGCHFVDGPIALAFARMRYSDPMSDIGRGDRQRQVINAIMHRVIDRTWIKHPHFANFIAETGLAALTVDESSNILSFVTLALAFRAANGPDGIHGTPPIKDLDFRPGNNLGSTVLIDPEAGPQFWRDLMNGDLEPGPVGLAR